MSCEYRLLQDKDIEEIVDFVEENDINDEKIFFKDELLTEGFFKERILRDQLFNYKALIYGKYENEVLKDIMYCSIPEISTNSTAICLYLVSLNYNESFMEFVLENLKEEADGEYTKVKLIVNCNEDFVLKLTNSGFEKELEISNGKHNVKYLAVFFNEGSSAL